MEAWKEPGVLMLLSLPKGLICGSGSKSARLAGEFGKKAMCLLTLVGVIGRGCKG